jgi:hypothetical protein
MDSYACQSQAVLLLILGLQLRGESQGTVLIPIRTADLLPVEDLQAFPVPALQPTRTRLSAGTVQTRLIREYGASLIEGEQGELGLQVDNEVMVYLGQQLYDDPSPLAAAMLMEVCLSHPDELVSVAAAAAYFELRLEPRRLLRILENGAHSEEPLIRDVAATALSRVAPENSHLQELLVGTPAVFDAAPSHTSLVLHGTFARSYSWWQPGGDFHTYLLTQVRNDLYSSADRFDWSGGYSDAARLLAAHALTTWVTNHGLNGLSMFTHSHGGTIAMLANHAGIEIDELVLLSCPVHVPRYLPNFSHVRRVVSIHVHLDPVILADRGAQRFSHPNIQEHVLPVWFDHSATHYPDVWIRNNVPALL